MPKMLITYFLMSSVTNAFILCKYKGGLTGRDSISLFEFIDLLMDDIEEIPREEDSDCAEYCSKKFMKCASKLADSTGQHHTPTTGITVGHSRGKCPVQ